MSDGKSKVASAITNKGVSTAADATFDTMSTNIESISTEYSWFMPMYLYDGGYIFVGYDAKISKVLSARNFTGNSGYEYTTLNFYDWVTISRSSTHSFKLVFKIDIGDYKAGDSKSFSNFYNYCYRTGCNAVNNPHETWIVYN